jgi:hypothetical protein
MERSAHDEGMKVARLIEQIIEAIREEGKLSEGLIRKKAETMRDYDKEMGKATAALKAANTPVSIIDRRAKEKTCEYLCEKILAEESLKAHFKRLDYLQAQLNGYQSVYRHLDSM